MGIEALKLQLAGLSEEELLRAIQTNPTLKDLLTPRLNKYIPWTPTEKQQAWLCLDCEEAFFGGAAGPGKSVGLLMAAAQYVDLPGYNAIILRDKHTNLTKPEGLIELSHTWFAETDARWVNGDHWEFPNGATLSFGYLDGPNDHFNYQGPAYQFVGIDEVVGIRKHQALYLFSRLRKSDRCSDVPLRFRCASNPPAREQLKRGAWVKERYVSPLTRDPGVIFIPAKIEDNPHLNAKEYKEKSLSKLDPVTRKQLEEGDWNIRVTGRFFKRHWFTVVHSYPTRNIKWIRYWDFAGTEKKDEDPDSKDPDWTSGALVGVTPDGLFFVLNIVRGQWSPRQIELIVKQTAATDGTAIPIWIEEEPGSSGKHVTDYYRRHVLRGYQLRGHPKRKSKMSSWGIGSSASGLLANKAEAGDVFLVAGPWVGPFLDEIVLVPDGAYDDQTDSVAGAIEKLAGVGAGVTPRIKVVRDRADSERFVEKPEVKPGEELIAIWEGDRIVGYEKLYPRRRRPGIMR
jgi:predicted phage terminase large subunit-like protein